MPAYDDARFRLVQRIYDRVRSEVVGIDTEVPMHVKEAMAKAVLSMDGAGQRNEEKIARYAAYRGRIALAQRDAFDGIDFAAISPSLLSATRLVRR